MVGRGARARSPARSRAESVARVSRRSRAIRAARGAGSARARARFLAGKCARDRGAIDRRTDDLLHRVLDELVERVELLPSEAFLLEERADHRPRVLLPDLLVPVEVLHRLRRSYSASMVTRCATRAGWCRSGGVGARRARGLDPEVTRTKALRRAIDREVARRDHPREVPALGRGSGAVTPRPKKTFDTIPLWPWWRRSETTGATTRDAETRAHVTRDALDRALAMAAREAQDARRGRSSPRVPLAEEAPRREG